MTARSKLPITTLEAHRLQWLGVAWLHREALESHEPGTPEAIAAQTAIDEALAEAAECEAEVVKRRARRAKDRAEPVLESPAPRDAPETETELPPSNLVIGPWGSKLRR